MISRDDVLVTHSLKRDLSRISGTLSSLLKVRLISGICLKFAVLISVSFRFPSRRASIPVSSPTAWFSITRPIRNSSGSKSGITTRKVVIRNTHPSKNSLRRLRPCCGNADTARTPGSRREAAQALSPRIRSCFFVLERERSWVIAYSPRDMQPFGRAIPGLPLKSLRRDGRCCGGIDGNQE